MFTQAHKAKIKTGALQKKKKFFLAFLKALLLHSLIQTHISSALRHPKQSAALLIPHRSPITCFGHTSGVPSVSLPPM